MTRTIGASPATLVRKETTKAKMMAEHDNVDAKLPCAAARRVCWEVDQRSCPRLSAAPTTAGQRPPCSRLQLCQAQQAKSRRIPLREHKAKRHPESQQSQKQWQRDGEQPSATAIAVERDHASWPPWRKSAAPASSSAHSARAHRWAAVRGRKQSAPKRRTCAARAPTSIPAPSATSAATQLRFMDVPQSDAGLGSGGPRRTTPYGNSRNLQMPETARSDNVLPRSEEGTKKIAQATRRSRWPRRPPHRKPCGGDRP